VNPLVQKKMSPGLTRQASRALLIALTLLLAGGCAMFNTGPEVEYPPLTSEQAEWWQANRQRARYVKGKGYYVEGTSGFFDHEGHRISSDLGVGADTDKRGLIARLIPNNIGESARKAIGQGPNESVAKNALSEGDSLFRQKKYEEAMKAYRQAYKRWPDSPLEEEAMFKAGESAFFADDYVHAEDEYERLIKKFQSTQFLSQVTERRFAIGRYWEAKDRAHPKFILVPNISDGTLPRFDTGGHALKVYERIRLDDPIGPRADDAVMATANAYFLKGRWDDADYYYGLLRSEFPKSEHQFQAHLLGLRCKLIRYQGPGYDGSQLDEAEDIATQLLTQFPQELGEERERVVQVRAEVRTQRALREYDMAEFYAKNEYYGAARHYYAKVVEDYPDTKLAEQSRTRMSEFAAEPASPTPTFQWLVDILPASKKNGPQITLPASSSTSVQNVASASEGNGLK
jgi:outer membrane protein assembly factor BamD (BamD/ComL family)